MRAGLIAAVGFALGLACAGPVEREEPAAIEPASADGPTSQEIPDTAPPAPTTEPHPAPWLLPPTGEEVPELAALDMALQDLMAEWEIAGLSFAFARGCEVVLRRGYGVADRATGERMRSDHRLRIASMSKPITAAAVMSLVEAGELRLDDRAIDWLGGAPHGADPRLGGLTIRHLLTHSTGWDRNRSGNLFRENRLEPLREALGRAPRCEHVLAAALARPMDFDPGSEYAYSNLGYCALSQIVERASGFEYETYSRARILRPAGAAGARLGAETPGDDEPRYQTGDWERRIYMEPLEGAASWVATAEEVVRVALALDPTCAPQVLAPETVHQMTAERPSIPRWVGSDWFYGLGWQIKPKSWGANWWHTGSLPGVTGIVTRTRGGTAWAALVHGRPQDNDTFKKELGRAIWNGFEALE